MEPMVTFQLSTNNEASYSVNLNIVPLRIYSGFGDWNGEWTLSNDNLVGIQILTGGGEYIGSGNHSTVLFKCKLQLTRKDKRIIPFPEPDAKISIWEGYLSLVGGNVQGFLSRTSGNDYPNCYNFNAVYSKSIDGKTILINVSNIKLSI